MLTKVNALRDATLSDLYANHGASDVKGKIKQFGTLMSLLDSGWLVSDIEREHQLQKWLDVLDLSHTHWQSQQAWEMVAALDNHLKGVHVPSLQCTLPSVCLLYTSPSPRD